MSTLDLFKYQSHDVRVVVLDGEAWFVASDVSRVLEYRMASDMTRRLDEEDKGYAEVRTPGGDQQMTVINESGLYDAAFRSNAVGARKFKRWVTSDLIPTLRKTGTYSIAPVPAPTHALPQSFAEALELAARQARELEAKTAELEQAAPKVEAFDAFMDADGTYSMGAAARMLGLGRTTLFRRLREEGIFQKAQNLPYREYDRYFFMKPGTRPDRKGAEVATLTPKVRPEGVEWLRKRLRAQAIPSGLIALQGGA